MASVVVLASCLMLTTAQLQMPVQQIISLPNLQPMQVTALPNSEILMTQSAHSILNQDLSTPLSPGIFGSVPVLVSEAAQSVLDQESRIVGYNLPSGIQETYQQSIEATQQSQDPLPTAQLQFRITSPPNIPLTPNDAINLSRNDEVQQQPQPHSLSFSLLNQPVGKELPVNIIPVRATASLKSLLTSLKHKDTPFKLASFQQSSSSQSAADNVYYDIPPNHPVPPPSLTQPHEHNLSYNPSEFGNVHVNRVVDQSQEQSFRPHYEADTGEEVVFMRPPPPTPFQSFFRPSNDHVNENHDRPQSHQAQKEERYYNQEASRHSYSTPTTSSPPISREEKGKDKSSKRKKPKNLPSKLGDATNQGSTIAKSKHNSIQDSLESPSNNIDTTNPQNSDSATQPSEDSFLRALLQAHENNRPRSQESPLVYESLKNYNAQGYQSTNGPSGSVVHKHIFVHAAPETYPQGPRVRVIRPPVNQEKHLQIIFVKSPTEAPAAETIVELPQTEQPKTLVYILSKKPEEAGADVKVISPPARKPQAPEIYFIRYGDRRENQGYPVPDLHSLNLSENNSHYDNTDGQPLAVASPESINPQLLSFLRQKRNRDYGLDVYAPLMAYSNTGQINEITQEEADSRRSTLDGFF